MATPSKSEFGSSGISGQYDDHKGKRIFKFNGTDSSGKKHTGLQLEASSKSNAIQQIEKSGYSPDRNTVLPIDEFNNVMAKTDNKPSAADWKRASANYGKKKKRTT